MSTIHNIAMISLVLILLLGTLVTGVVYAGPVLPERIGYIVCGDGTVALEAKQFRDYKGNLL